MRARKALIIALVGVYSLLLSCPGAWGWQRNINGTASGGNRANAVVVGTAGNVVAAGATNITCVNYDGRFCYAYASAFAVIKFDGASGVELWRRDINGVLDSYNSVNALALDGAGNVIAVGETNRLCVDSNCNIHVSDFTVIKLNGASGEELWRRDFNTANGYNGNRALAVAVDAAGNVVAGGEIDVGSAVVKFEGLTGRELWRANAGSYGASAVAVDAAGNVVAGGVYDFTVIKFDGASGQEMWRQVIVGTDNEYPGSASALAVDGAGNVAAAGFTYNASTGEDFTVVKFDGASGAELWRRVITGTYNEWGFDGARAVAVDAAGDVIAAGGTTNIGDTGVSSDFTVIKFDGTSGQQLWRQLTEGSYPNSYDAASAVVVDGAGNVVAAGTTQNLNAASDFTVVKLDGATGANLWREVVIGNADGWDSANAVAVDAAGNVVAAGYTGDRFSISVGYDFTVVKFTGIPVTFLRLTANLASPQNAGTSITFTATATDGTDPLQYKWWVYNGSWWELVQNWSTNNSFSWTPTATGNFKVAVWVRSGGNTVDWPENNAYGVMDFTVTPLSVTSLTADRISPQPAGTTITFTAATTGGVAPIQYKWWMFNGAAWVLMQNWSTSNAYSWTPTVPGNFKVAVWVRSSGNTIDAPENNAYGVVDFAVYPLSVTGLTADKTSPQLAGTTITFTAATQGGLAPIQYKWWMFSGASWVLMQNWSTNNTYSWIPTVTGNFKIAVWVRSSGNTIDAPENNAYGVLDFSVYPLSVTGLTADKTSPQPAGTIINFTAATTGGVAPIQYKWWVYNGMGWSSVQNWSTSNSFSWTPTATGNFKVAVWVKSTGNIVDEPENNAYGVVDFTISGGMSSGVGEWDY